ncbi:hypothetical protein CP533_1225 [Ophiocordyceps camponoti-saundersi (nom. inval.)]|nr:hypothetical protein CP533_1225 [Ophiocordyceps camponoti-saundersi (nom. inval.)]
MRIPSLISTLLTMALWPALGAAAEKPYYAIAHRVLEKKGVDQALSDGANAIEIDAYSREASGWWADHDGILTSKGDKMVDILTHVANKAKEGKKVAFVWLDIKNPDYCKIFKQSCSIEALRDTARQILSPVNIQILYGFYTKKRGRAYGVIRDGLNHNEAIVLDGDAEAAQRIFEEEGPTNITQRAFSRGYFNWHMMWYKDYNAMLDNLRKASDSGAFGQVFGWTLVKDRFQLVTNIDDPVQDIVNDADTSGVIYGNPASAYDDADRCSWGIQQLKAMEGIRLARGDELAFTPASESWIKQGWYCKKYKQKPNLEGNWYCYTSRGRRATDELFFNQQDCETLCVDSLSRKR